MDCRITSIRRAPSGFTVVELMVATALGAILATGVAGLVFYSSHSIAAMGNYVDLDHRSRIALDTMSRAIRQANRLISYSSTSLTFEDSDGGNLVFAYDPNEKTLRKTKNGVTENQPLLEECDYLQFSIYQRNTIGGTYNQFPTSPAATCKLVQLNWVCSRKILGAKVNTESVQSAKIVIRKQ